MKSWTLKRVSQRVWDNLILILALVAAGVLAFTIAKVVSVSHKADRTARQAKALSRDGKQAHDAICALKGDLSQRITQGRVFLKKHPNGILGIPATTIKQGIDNQQRTLDSLSVVKCSADERKRG